jgi:hypothetical protein
LTRSKCGTVLWSLLKINYGILGVSFIDLFALISFFIPVKGIDIERSKLILKNPRNDNFFCTGIPFN